MSKYVSENRLASLKEYIEKIGSQAFFSRNEGRVTPKCFHTEPKKWIIDYTDSHLYEIDRDSLDIIPILFLERIPFNAKIQSCEEIIGNSYASYIGRYIQKNYGTLSLQTMKTLENWDKEWRNTESTTSGKGNAAPVLCASLVMNMNLLPDLLNSKTALTEYLLAQKQEFENFGINTILVNRYPAQRGIYQDICFRVCSNHKVQISPMVFKTGTIGAGRGILIDLDRKKVLATIAMDSKYKEYFLLKTNLGRDKKLNPNIFKIYYDESFISENSPYAKELLKVWKKCTEVLPNARTETIDGANLYEQLYSNRLNAPFENLGPIEQIEENEKTLQEFIKKSGKTPGLPVVGNHSGINGVYITQ